jgi:hypothetical protein
LEDKKVNITKLALTVSPISNLTEVEPLTVTPTIIMPADIVLKTNYIVSRVALEVGWMFTCDMDEDFNITITDVFIPKQEVHGATTEIDPEGLGQVCRDLIAKGKGSDIGKIRGWSHSHVNMAPSPSGQDHNQFEQLHTAEGVEDFFVMMIHNKAGQVFSQVADKECQVKYTNVPIRVVMSSKSPEIIKEEIEEIEKHLNERVSYLSSFTNKPTLKVSNPAKPSNQSNNKSYGKSTTFNQKATKK